MKGDFTRDTFDPFKHFSRVLMQQGRVQLDADWNEQSSILLRFLRAVTADVVGQHGGPGNGFMIEKVIDGGKLTDLMIHAGHYYVDGILCENEGRFGRIEEKVLPGLYYEQPDYPLSRENTLFPNLPLIVYLDVWERHVTCVEDETIREVALGGPDTAARAKVVWQVKVVSAQDVTDCAGASEWIRFNLKPLSGAKLRARARKEQPEMEACAIPPESRYRGPENQLYRVEVHTGSRNSHGETVPPTFKWSRENGSVIFPIREITEDGPNTVVELDHLGRDDKLSLTTGDWVEIVDDDYVLHQMAEPLLRVLSVDRQDFRVTLEGHTGGMTGRDPDRHPLLRRWDQQADVDGQGAVMIKEREPSNVDDWLALEDGIAVLFEAGFYRTGDYWLIPARTVTGDVEWPREQDGTTPRALPPRGVHHHYAPLAVVTQNTAGEVTVHDCRRVLGLEQRASDVPIGTVVAWAGSPEKLPAGWLLCRGQALSKAGEFAALATALGSTFSVDANHFRVPDLQGRVVVGDREGGEGRLPRHVGDEYGADTHKLTLVEIPQLAFIPHHHAWLQFAQGRKVGGSDIVLDQERRHTFVRLKEKNDEFERSPVAPTLVPEGAKSLLTSDSPIEIDTANVEAAQAISLNQPSFVLNYIIRYA